MEKLQGSKKSPDAGGSALLTHLLRGGPQEPTSRIRWYTRCMHQVYISQKPLLAGTSVSELESAARRIYRELTARSKRTPYLRSAYFKGQKIFLTLYWSHLYQKNWRDRARRLKLYACALDLLRHSTLTPTTVENPNQKDQLLHRFAGQTKSGQPFTVQVKEQKNTGKKYFISAFFTD